MNDKLRISLVVGGCLVGVFILGKYMFPPLIRKSAASFRPNLEKQAADIRKTLPKMTGETTEWYAVEAEKDTLVFHYRLLDEGYSQATYLARAPEVMASVKKADCENVLVKFAFFRRGTSLKHVFRGKDMSFYGEVLVTPTDCGYKK